MRIGLSFTLQLKLCSIIFLSGQFDGHYFPDYFSYANKTTLMNNVGNSVFKIIG